MADTNVPNANKMVIDAKQEFWSKYQQKGTVYVFQ